MRPAVRKTDERLRDRETDKPQVAPSCHLTIVCMTTSVCPRQDREGGDRQFVGVGRAATDNTFHRILSG